MKVFVAGATGVVGRRAVVRMIAAGFEVSGVARSPQQRAGLVAAGVRPIEVDLFDHDAVLAAVGDQPPRSARGVTQLGRRRHRRWGGPLRAGVDRLAVRRRRRPCAGRVVAVAPTDITDSALEAETEAERFAAHGRAGVAPRFGQFYGFDSVHSVHAMEAVRAGRPAELGPPSAYRSSITTDDAASAIVAVLDVASGVYSVIDDLPLSRAGYVGALTDALGVPAPAVSSLDVELADLRCATQGPRRSTRTSAGSPTRARAVGRAAVFGTCLPSDVEFPSAHARPGQRV